MYKAQLPQRVQTGSYFVHFVYNVVHRGFGGLVTSVLEDKHSAHSLNGALPLLLGMEEIFGSARTALELVTMAGTTKLLCGRCSGA